MSAKRVYVNGPISGYPNGNETSFRDAATKLIALGWNVVVPFDCPPVEHRGPCPLGYASPHVGEHAHHDSTACFIRGDLRALLDCDAVYLLRNWERSVGARAEFEVAAIAGLEVYYQHAPNLVAFQTPLPGATL